MSSYALVLPQEVRSSEGWVFTLNRIELLESIDDDIERRRPENGIYLMMIGTVSNFTDRDACMMAEQFILRDGAKEYKMSFEIARAAHDIYGLDYPGFFLGQCLDYDETADSFLIFDAPKEGIDLWLQLGDAEVQLGQMPALLQATPIPGITSTPIPTDTPLPTPTKARKPPTSTPVADCDRTGYPRRGWLYDYDRKGEVALWAKPNLPFKDGNTVLSTVPIPVVGGSVVVTVLEECMNDGILFYLVEPGTGARYGYADVDYVYFEKP